ncbi:GHMP kinase, partial [bacterium]|nr:GHMP kinase [bacterium]
MQLFVPGRICLFGEHSDWAGGYRRINSEIEKGFTVISGTNQGIYADVEPHPSKLIVSSRLYGGEEIGPYELPMEKAALLQEAEKGGFFSYAAGVAHVILTHYHVNGLKINCHHMDLPLKKGLSSSAAFCVLVARAFNRIYDLKMTVRGEMEIAYQGELLTPSRCGRMDQGCAFGVRPVVMEYDRDLLHVKELSAGGDFYYVIVDLNAEKDTKKILAQLNQHYPFPTSEIGEGVHKYLGKINKEIVAESIVALEKGDAERVGTLMIKAQQFFDQYMTPACPEELTAPKLHQVMNYPAIQSLIYGGKGVGSQGDGTLQLLARDEASQQQVIDILEKELDVSCLAFHLSPPSRIRKAVITAAGFGSPMFPATKALKKELFPVPDKDGIVKPAILIIIEEALAAGIEEVALIIEKGDEDIFQSFFNQPLPPHHLNRLPLRFKDYPRYLQEVGRKVRLIPQPAQEGLGHAVACAREWVGNEPFLLMLGDHLYRSSCEKSCAAQVMDIYYQNAKSVVGLKLTSVKEIGQYGTVGGHWHDSSHVLDIAEFAEKPTVEYAHDRLRVSGLKPNEFLTIFGMYVLKPDIFDYLAEIIDGNLREQGEFPLTPALDRLRQHDSFDGVLVQGSRFDIGSPDSYIHTI